MIALVFETWSHLRVVGISAALAAVGSAQTTTRVSVTPTGGEANGGSYFSAISDDGRYVVFNTDAFNLVPAHPNTSGVVLHDRQTGQNELVSISSAGVAGYGDIPALSADGRYATFTSVGTNLVPVTNNFRQIIARDRQAATTTLVSKSSGGVLGNGDSYQSSISADGRYVVFDSFATNLVAGDGNGFEDVFLHDRQTATTTRVSVDAAGGDPNSSSTSPQISADGRYIAFESNASDLVIGDSNGTSDIFVRDRLTGTTVLVSKSSLGVQGNGGSSEASLSSTGRFVVFFSSANNLVAGDTNFVYDVFVHDRDADADGVFDEPGAIATTRVSVGPGGVQGDNPSYSTWSGRHISSDGRYVTFTSYATNLIAGGTSGAYLQAFARDRQTGQTFLCSANNAGVESNLNDVYGEGISGNGRFVTFNSFATNLVAGDSNGFEDIFVHDLQLPPPINYCTAGTTSNGCNATMFGLGIPSATYSAGFTLGAMNVEGQKQGLIFYSVSGRLANVWTLGSTSYLCVNTPVQRTPVQSSGGSLNACDGVLSLDWNTYMFAHPAALGQPGFFGQLIDSQAWFRDPTAPGMTNLSDGIEFTLDN